MKAQSHFSWYSIPFLNCLVPYEHLHDRSCGLDGAASRHHITPLASAAFFPRILKSDLFFVMLASMSLLALAAVVFTLIVPSLLVAAYDLIIHIPRCALQTRPSHRPAYLRASSLYTRFSEHHATALVATQPSSEHWSFV